MDVGHCDRYGQPKVLIVKSGSGDCRMRTRLLLCLVAAMVMSGRVHADQPEIISICNKGDAVLDVASVIYVHSLLFGDSYQAKGWRTVNPGNCEMVFTSDDRDPVYLGFVYRDFKNTRRTHESQPKQDAVFFKAAAEKFCVAPTDAFAYKTQTKEALRNCRPGFQPLEFSLYVSGVPDDYGRISYDMFPDRTDTDSQVFDWQPSAGAIPKLFAKGTRNASLQLAQIVAWNFGNDQRWYYENGTPVPDAYKFAGVLESPLVDSRFKDDKVPPDGFRTKITQLEALIKSQLPPGSEFLEEFSDWICNVYNATYYCAHLYALDFEKAELVNSPGFIHLTIPCRSGIVRGGAPYGDALCSIHGREWKAADGTANKIVFIGRDMDAVVQTDTLFVVSSEESGKAILSALSQLAMEFERYYEPKPITSVPVQ